jgi:hypothetical protein
LPASKAQRRASFAAGTVGRDGITGTGNNIGKTFVVASLIGHFRQIRRRVEAIKQGGEEIRANLG